MPARCGRARSGTRPSCRRRAAQRPVARNVAVPLRWRRSMFCSSARRTGRNPNGEPRSTGMPVTPSILRASSRCVSTTGDGSGTYTTATLSPSCARKRPPSSKLPTCAVRQDRARAVPARGDETFVAGSCREEGGRIHVAPARVRGGGRSTSASAGRPSRARALDLARRGAEGRERPSDVVENRLADGIARPDHALHRGRLEMRATKAGGSVRRASGRTETRARTSRWRDGRRSSGSSTGSPVRYAARMPRRRGALTS